MFLEPLIIAIIVSIDGIFEGLSYGINKIKINISKLLVISFIPFITTLPILILGNTLSLKIPNIFLNYISFILFMFLAVNSFIQIKNKKAIKLLTYKESVLIGLSIAADSLVAALAISNKNYNPYLTASYFGIFHGIFIKLGNKLGMINKIKNTDNIKYSSPILLTLIAISKLF